MTKSIKKFAASVYQSHLGEGSFTKSNLIFNYSSSLQRVTRVISFTGKDNKNLENMIRPFQEPSSLEDGPETENIIQTLLREPNSLTLEKVKNELKHFGVTLGYYFFKAENIYKIYIEMYEDQVDFPVEIEWSQYPIVEGRAQNLLNKKLVRGESEFYINQILSRLIGFIKANVIMLRTIFDKFENTYDLFYKGEGINNLNKEELTALLDVAAKYNMLDLGKLLIEAGADVGEWLPELFYPPFHEELRESHNKFKTLLIDNGVYKPFCEELSEFWFEQIKKNYEYVADEYIEYFLENGNVSANKVIQINELWIEKAIDLKLLAEELALTLFKRKDFKSAETIISKCKEQGYLENKIFTERLQVACTQYYNSSKDYIKCAHILETQGFGVEIIDKILEPEIISERLYKVSEKLISSKASDSSTDDKALSYIDLPLEILHKILSFLSLFQIEKIEDCIIEELRNDKNLLKDLEINLTGAEPDNFEI